VTAIIRNIVFSAALALGAGLTVAPAASAQTPLTGATAVSTGDLHACAVVNGGVKCWGTNPVGQLGDGTEIDRAIATDVVGLPAGSNVTAVAAGVEHSCAIADGGVLCWGRNAEGQLGIGTPSFHVTTPVPALGLEPGSSVTSIAAGYFYTCAVANGAVFCWGDNSMGFGSAMPAPQLFVGSGATMAAVGYDHACAVVDSGVQCWGAGAWGQLGHGAAASSDVPVWAIPAGSGATAVSAGHFQSCALVAGQPMCWGLNTAGQLGNGEMGNYLHSVVPVNVLGFPDGAAAIAAGDGHTCAIADGGVQCWGANLWGSVGNGVMDFGSYPVPAPVIGLGPGSGATDVSAGMYFTCAVVNGGVLCWGLGDYGELGTGNLVSSAVPVAVVVDDPAVNTAPTPGPITILPASVVPLETLITATVSFTDPDPGDTHTCSVSWGDGTVQQGLLGASGCSATHSYAAPGVYLVTASVTDAAGATGSATYAYVVVFDPSAGYVTGGGWFDSAPGAYTPDRTLAGRAHFGFVARYQKGRSVPDGHTEFQFQAAGLHFRSSSYEWLVIAGSKAIYKGVGTVNGGGDYGFQLTAMDGQLDGSGADRIRVKIWDRSTGAVVYDNQTCGATGDDADACTVLGGGSIVVHASKK
jgi:alpha-tubulin suppressor-like RCC1 family protein/PKD repeat protein